PHYVKRLSLAYVLVPVAMLALAASACGDGHGGSATSTTAPPPPPTATKNQINAMPRDRVQDGGRFTWPLDGMPPNFNYNELDGTAADNFYVISALMPAAYVSDAAGTPLW